MCELESNNVCFEEFSFLSKRLVSLGTTSARDLAGLIEKY